MTKTRPPLRSGFRSWFRSAPAQRMYTHVIDQPFLFPAPTKDDAYQFDVVVRLQWTGTGHCSLLALNAEIDRSRERFRWFVNDTVRQIARGFKPYRPEEAEAAVNARLHGVRVVENGIHLECTAVTRVVPPQAVVQQLQQVWQQRLEREAGHESAVREIGTLIELRTHWRQFLSDGMEDWITPYAVRLAGHENLAKVTDAMLADRHKAAQELLERINRLVDAQQAANVFDFVQGSDTVLRRTLEMLGLPVPESARGSMFGPDDVPPQNGRGRG
ncbi:hypothetical protein Acor_34890 [Acrocarpospora corrugata]|uniref:Uncharacterized protein n=1 Tax=Acrocarpospora corrugata TaxID=35763 RepID=A0A5M3VX90_9ACTN|nr:hypothetical protein [Acrocarpospora corrugata]GES01425.1 hypothetical protein Acor_34890 [Acrocarpospora corrugata]